MVISILEKKQEQLQKEANEVLSELEIIPLFSKFGKPQIVGSMALEVMTRKDIDVETIVKQYDRQKISKIVMALSQKQLPRIDFTIIDNTCKQSNNIPFGFCIGIKYAGKDKLFEKFKNNPFVWQIDCWFLTEENAKGSKITKSFQVKLTPEKRKIILEIKSVLTDSPNYKKTIFGIDIYKAILENNVKNFEEFKSYLKQIGKSL